jgi:hypothetical protein
MTIRHLEKANYGRSEGRNQRKYLSGSNIESGEMEN